MLLRGSGSGNKDVFQPWFLLIWRGMQILSQEHWDCKSTTIWRGDIVALLPEPRYTPWGDVFQRGWHSSRYGFQPSDKLKHPQFTVVKQLWTLGRHEGLSSRPAIFRWNTGFPTLWFDEIIQQAASTVALSAMKTILLSMPVYCFQHWTQTSSSSVMMALMSSIRQVSEGAS